MSQDGDTSSGSHVRTIMEDNVAVRFPLLLELTSAAAQDRQFISYATAVSAIIGTPFKIETMEQARKLPKVRLYFPLLSSLYCYE
jgi:hypothetical protein